MPAHTHTHTHTNTHIHSLTHTIILFFYILKSSFDFTCSWHFYWQSSLSYWTCFAQNDTVGNLQLRYTFPKRQMATRWQNSCLQNQSGVLGQPQVLLLLMDSGSCWWCWPFLRHSTQNTGHLLLASGRHQSHAWSENRENEMHTNIWWAPDNCQMVHSLMTKLKLQYYQVHWCKADHRSHCLSVKPQGFSSGTPVHSHSLG